MQPEGPGLSQHDSANDDIGAPMVENKQGQLRKRRGGLHKVYTICGTFLERGDM